MPENSIRRSSERSPLVPFFLVLHCASYISCGRAGDVGARPGPQLTLGATQRTPIIAEQASSRSAKPPMNTGMLTYTEAASLRAILRREFSPAPPISALPATLYR
jgi:hypothetical protein